MGVKDLAPALSIYRQRLRTPIMYPLCITSNFSNFSHFLSSSLLACQQLPREGHGHFARRSHMRHELGYHQGIQPSNGRFYSLQPPPPGPATPGGSLAARGRPQCRPGPRAPAHPGGGGGGAQEQV